MGKGIKNISSFICHLNAQADSTEVKGLSFSEVHVHIDHGRVPSKFR